MSGELPGSPVITLCTSTAEGLVQSLTGGLRPHKACGQENPQKDVLLDHEKVVFLKVKWGDLLSYRKAEYEDSLFTIKYLLPSQKVTFYLVISPTPQSFSSVQSLSRVWLFMTPWTAACQASLSNTNSRSLPKLTIESVMPSNHLILCRPLLLLPSIFCSIRVFSNESALRIRWPKYWSFSFNISPSNEHLWLISFRMDWRDLLAVQGTLESLLQPHSSKAPILLHSAFLAGTDTYCPNIKWVCLWILF